jgi:hypothetical protein
MGSTTRILSVMAQVGDAEAVTSVLALIRDRDKLAERLSSGATGFAFEYNEELKIGRYLVSDAITLMCFSVTDITPREAYAIAAECRKMPEWGHEEFQAAAGRALGGTFERLQ